MEIVETFLIIAKAYLWAGAVCGPLLALYFLFSSFFSDIKPGRYAHNGEKVLVFGGVTIIMLLIGFLFPFIAILVLYGGNYTD